MAKADAQYGLLDAGNIRWLVRTESLHGTLLDAIQSPARFAAAKRAPDGSFFLKRYTYDDTPKALKYVFRVCPAQNAFDAALALRAAGFLTPMPLAVGHRRSLGLLRESFLITEHVGKACKLADWKGNRVQMAHALAALVIRLKRLGYIHDDLNSSNFLIDRDNRIHLLDLDTMRYVQSVTEAQSLKQIARFSRKALMLPSVSRTQRLRFLRDYCAMRPVNDWKDWWRKINVLNREKYAYLTKKAAAGNASSIGPRPA